MSGDVSSTDLEGVVCVSTSDMVLAISSSPQFVQAPGTLIHMSSLSGESMLFGSTDTIASRRFTLSTLRNIYELIYDR